MCPDEDQAAPTETAPPPTETETGCASCHTIDGTSSVGPTVNGLAGSTVELDDGQTVTADGAYLTRSLTDPDAQVVAGFPAGVMSASTAPQKLDTRPHDVEALVAYIEAQG